MKKETVERVINRMSAGQQFLNLILKDNYEAHKNEIDDLPEWAVRTLRTGLGTLANDEINNLFQFTDCYRVNFIDIWKDGKSYWDTPKGKDDNEIINAYSMKKLIRGMNTANVRKNR